MGNDWCRVHIGGFTVTPRGLEATHVLSAGIGTVRGRAEHATATVHDVAGSSAVHVVCRLAIT